MKDSRLGCRALVVILVVVLYVAGFHLDLSLEEIIVASLTLAVGLGSR